MGVWLQAENGCGRRFEWILRIIVRLQDGVKLRTTSPTSRPRLVEIIIESLSKVLTIQQDDFPLGNSITLVLRLFRIDPFSESIYSKILSLWASW